MLIGLSLLTVHLSHSWPVEARIDISLMMLSNCIDHRSVELGAASMFTILDAVRELSGPNEAKKAKLIIHANDPKNISDHSSLITRNLLNNSRHPPNITSNALT